MSTSIETLRSKATSIIDAIRQLEEAKKAIQTENPLAETNSLAAQQEKEQLELSICALNNEKRDLTTAVVNAKKQLDELIGQIGEDQPVSSITEAAEPTLNDDNDFLTGCGDEDGELTPLDLGQESQETCLETQDFMMDDQVGSQEALGRDAQSLCSSSSISSTRRSKARKTSRAPKKWRRMMRTHRLKSILSCN